MSLMSKLNKVILASRLFLNIFRVYSTLIFRTHKPKRLTIPSPPGPKTRNIVVVGANFAGYLAARIIAVSLPPDSPYRVVVVEPNSHFNFTWVLPRFCVAEGGHEHKAFIPYGPLLNGAPVEWVRDRVAEVGRGSVRLEGGREMEYEILVIATGCGAGDGLPSRVGATSKVEGVGLLRGVQGRVKGAGRLLVVGGGAVGVEVAADAKSLYPGKSVTLVHSGDAVMHRFGAELQAEALRSLRELGVELILGDRLLGEDEDEEGGIATLKSGKTVEYDYIVRIPHHKLHSDLQEVTDSRGDLPVNRYAASASDQTRKSSPDSRRTLSPPRATSERSPHSRSQTTPSRTSTSAAT